MIAGGRNMFTAYKARLPFLDINQEREHAYAGYEGMVELARRSAARWKARSGRRLNNARHGNNAGDTPMAQKSIKTRKPLATQPIKSGQTAGAILASLGIERCIPLIHGAQGLQCVREDFLYPAF